MIGRAFLATAEMLASASDEAAWRSAVSRAYYAAFHTACEYFRLMGFRVPREERAHKYTAFRLNNSGHPIAERLGLKIDRLRSARNRADYDLDRPFDSDIANDNVDIGREIVDALASLRSSADIQSIRDAIRAYERDVLGENTWRA
ncbi:MAG: HEPN domain-containing protein [Gemmataceae bacterium]|nr:HEPN domain-containing protein [Gemmataceae bacterium]